MEYLLWHVIPNSSIITVVVINKIDAILSIRYYIYIIFLSYYRRIILWKWTNCSWRYVKIVRNQIIIVRKNIIEFDVNKNEKIIQKKNCVYYNSINYNIISLEVYIIFVTYFEKVIYTLNSIYFHNSKFFIE